MPWTRFSDKVKTPNSEGDPEIFFFLFYIPPSNKCEYRHLCRSFRLSSESEDAC